MTMRRLRIALGLHPRWMLVVLLAFGVELMPPSAVVAHRHAGGGVAHSHAGPIVNAAPAAADAVGKGLRTGPPRDLHHHVVQPLVAHHGPTLVAPAPVLIATDIVAIPSRAEIPAALGLRHARAPPDAT
jgi:hypothetical protein